MSESLTPFEGENLASYEALKTAIALADGFTLIFAVTNTEAGAQEVMRRLWREGIRYQKAWLRDPERPLIDQVAERTRLPKLPVMVLGLEAMTTVGRELDRSLRNLNWTRPQWTTRLPQAIVFWITTSMEALVARGSPDLWRFRSLRVEFDLATSSRASRISELRSRLRSKSLSWRIRLSYLLELSELSLSQDVLEKIADIVVTNNDASVDDHALDRLSHLYLWGQETDDKSLIRLGALPNLLSIRFNGANVTDGGVADFLLCEPRNSLYYASFQGCRVGRLTLKALKELPSIAALDITDTQIGNQLLGEIAQIETLTSLEFSGHRLLEDGLNDEGLRNLSSSKSLRYIVAPMSEVTDDSSSVMECFRKLWYLDLRRSDITDAFCRELIGFDDLIHLDLSDTAITDKSLDVILSMKRLKSVDLSGTFMTKEVIDFMKNFYSDRSRRVEVLY